MVTRDTLTQAHTNSLIFYHFLKACHYFNIQPNYFQLDQLTYFDVFFVVMGFILGQYGN
jgi:hypothetical protein